MDFGLGAFDSGIFLACFDYAGQDVLDAFCFSIISVFSEYSLRYPSSFKIQNSSFITHHLSLSE